MVSRGGVLLAADDLVRANSYDDAWEVGWVSHCRSVYTTSGKTSGFVLQVGDSITHANPYSQWPRYGSGKTADDSAISTWLHASDWGSVATDTSIKNGWYLAATDIETRGMTASTGIDTGEYLSGSGNGGTAMPSTTSKATALGYVADGVAYPANLQIDTVVAAFDDAMFAVLMLGTNDATGNTPAATFLGNLETIIDILEADNIVVILSTIPPHFSRASLVNAEYNPGIRALARSRQIPLIDYEAEILARRPSDWNGTLMETDNVHPTALQGGYSASDDPYDPGGDAVSHTTGEAAKNSGFLLRSWLTIQKLKEVKEYIVDGVDPESPADGDLAPLGAPDGNLNAADILIMQRIILGTITPGPVELSHGDLNQDGELSMQDLILQQQLIMQ